jgi:glutamate dehydrogenase (NADP+)
LTNTFLGIFTGKGLPFGGSLIPPEATGFGLVLFLCEMLGSRKVRVSGSGNVSGGCIMQLLQLGAIPIPCSDSRGVLLFHDGMKTIHLEAMHKLNNELRLP